MSSFYTNSVPVRNGDLQIKATTKAIANELVGQQGYQDWSTITQFYDEDPLKNHLKLQQWFGQQSTSTVPLFQDVLQNDAVLEVNGWEGTFTYDVPVESDTRLKTVDDTSYQMYAGGDGTTFKIVLNREFAPNTKLTCDGLDGDEIVISEAEPVRNLGYGFEHTAILNTNDPDKTYPSYLLEKDIEYFEIGHGVAEYGEKLALVHMPGATNYNTYEFQLGSPQGVETWTTGKANSIDLGLGTTDTKDYLNQVENFYRKGQEVVLMNEKVPGGGSKRTIASVLEMLAIQKFDRNMSTTMMFGRGGNIKTEKGVVRFNEGIWPQLRRGYIITYGKRGGMTKEHIKQARDYVFKGNPMLKTIDSKIKFKAGSEAFNNVMKIFKDEVALQLAALAPFLGSERMIPNPISGDIYNLQLKPVRFTNVWLMDIGQVEIEEDMTLNYANITDRNLAGMNPNGYDWTTYSMIIWDAADQYYSNNRDFPKGVTPIGDNKEANIWMVAPKGEKIYWGRENGRYSVERAKDILSSSKTMTTSFWIYGFGAMWVKDPSKFVTLELEKSARRGYK